MPEKATDPDRFANKGADSFWLLREAFESRQIMIPDDDELIQEITNLKYKGDNSKGTIRI